MCLGVGLGTQGQFWGWSWFGDWGWMWGHEGYLRTPVLGSGNWSGTWGQFGDAVSVPARGLAVDVGTRDSLGTEAACGSGFGNTGTVLTWGGWAGLGWGRGDDLRTPHHSQESFWGQGAPGMGTRGWCRDSGSVPELEHGTAPGLGTGTGWESSVGAGGVPAGAGVCGLLPASRLDQEQELRDRGTERPGTTYRYRGRDRAGAARRWSG